MKEIRIFPYFLLNIQNESIKMKKENAFKESARVNVEKKPTSGINI